MSDASMDERASKFTQFSYTHFQALTKQALSHMSSDSTTGFHFASASRPRGFTTNLLEACLTDFLNQMPSQAWLWHFAAPLIASALLLSSYPPDAHSFSPEYLFSSLYADPCKAAIASYTMHREIQRKFVSAVLHEFRVIFAKYEDGAQSASDVHRGLVVIGMFLLQWSAAESIQRFEQVAAKTFGKRKALISRALQLLVAYVEDGQYSLAAVQEAFRKTFDSPLQMFNPLRNDTKVAVTTTAVNDSLPWLFTNYNGGKRPDNIGYDVVRAEKAQDDISVSDA
ncbi:hypothetical protein Alg215_11272 [Pyrenophora tritici-repentis]|nr:hypothetical protein Alg215_11272 [Pyrenophora tritici-repentis]